jgi:hypothetical protein
VQRQFRFVVVEGDLEVDVARRVLVSAGVATPPPITNCRGGSRFWAHATRYERAARAAGPAFGLVDLERADCAPGLLKDKLGHMPHRDFVLRIAKRMTESWLIADRDAFARFMGVPSQLVPADPEAEPDPKATIVRLARRSRSREIRETIAPPDDAQGVKVGREYLPKLREFVNRAWDVQRAASRSDSLRRARAAVARILR